MRSMHIIVTTALTAVAVSASVLVSTSSAGAAPDDLKEARAGTSGYHDVTSAETDEYGPLADADGVTCIDDLADPYRGAMGVHYVKGALVQDAVVDAATPEALVYEPQKNGRLRLVGVEYVVFQAAWDAGNPEPPTLFGQTFELVRSGNRYGLPPFYELHAWIWKNNPSGMFVDWNPQVSCADA